MALTKIKLNELTPKADPILADSIVISDSENSGKGALVEITDLQTLIGGGGGGGGAVDSVAGKTGVVTLDASDIAETAALKIMTADERTKLTGIAEGAEVNTVDSVAGKTGVVTLDADDVSPTATKLWMSDTQSAKLAGIAENANNYTHPETHPQSMIEGLGDALAAKAAAADLTTHTGNTSNPHGVTKAQLGLENCDNTSDIDKPVSTAQATAIAACRPKHTYVSNPTPTAIAGERGNTYGITVNGCTLTLPSTSSPGYVDGDEICVIVGPSSVRTLTITSPDYIMRDGIGRQPFNTPFDVTGLGTFISFIKYTNLWVMSYPEYELSLKAPLASPALTGTPTAPTAATGTNTTQIATTEFCGNFNQKWTYTYFGAGGSITGEQWKIHGFGATGTLTVPLASSVASGVQVSAIVVAGGAEVVLTRSGSDQFLTPTGLATTYTLRGNGSSIVLVRVTASAWACVGAPDSMINAATANAIYDLPVTRTGTVSPGTDVVLFETGVLDPAWYDETHVLNVSFFAKNLSGLSSPDTFKVQLYNEANSTAYTVANIIKDTLKFDLFQASTYRASSSSVRCNIQFGSSSSDSGSVSLGLGSYKLRVVVTSTLHIFFAAAQVRFTK